MDEVPVEEVKQLIRTKSLIFFVIYDFETRIAETYYHSNTANHCHYTGKYRGAAHSICNLRYKENSYHPKVAHNEYVFDNLIIPKIAGEYREREILCIGENTEKYVYFFAQKKVC